MNKPCKIILSFMIFIGISLIPTTSLSEVLTQLELSQTELDYLEDKKNIKLCIDPDWMPYEKVDDNNQHVGMSADYMAIFMQRIGIPIQLVPTRSWSESVEFTKSRKCDILSLLNDSPDRRKYLNFTEPYIETESVIVTRKNVTYLDGLKDIAERSLSTPKDYLFEDWIRRDHPKIDLVTVANAYEGLLKVSSGETFAHLGSIYIVVHHIQKNQLSNLKISGVSKYKMNFSTGVRNDDMELLSVLNKAVKSLSEEDHVKIRRKWTSTRYEHGVDYSLLIKVLIVSILVLATILFWNRKLSLLNDKLVASEKSNVRLGRIIEQSFNEIFIFDAISLKFIQVNQGARNNLGYTLEELRQLTPFDIKPEFNHEKFNQLIQPLRNNTKESITFQTIHQRKDGTSYDVEILLQLMQSETPPVFITIINDITERRLAEEHQKQQQIKQHELLEQQVKERTHDLEEAKNEAETANEAKTKFLENVSHELRTPMHGILAYTEMGIKRVAKANIEKNLKYFTNIKTSADRLMMLLNDLMDTTDLESHTMELNFLQYPLTTVIQDCLSKQQEQLDKLGIDISVHTCNPDSASIDPTRLGKVINHLISNALKFTEEDKRLDINLIQTQHNDSPALLFSLRDHGKGITDNEISTIFDTFEQGKGLEIGTTKGVGLGLPISRNIIELHQGKIWAENHPDGGAIVSFIIPVEQPKS